MVTTPERIDHRPVRFDTNTRVFHWVNATSFVVMAATGALLFIPALGDLVGRRDLVRTLHEVAGVVAVVWAVAAVAGPWGGGLRGDLAEIDVLEGADRRWLRGGWRRDLFGRREDPDPGAPKFNAGQKLNAIFSAATIAVLAGTGTIMYFHTTFPQWLKAGANLVHDLAAVVLTIVVVGHVVMALRTRGSMTAMVRGHLPPRRGL